MLYKIYLTVFLLSQIGFIIWGITILKRNPINMCGKYTWHIIIMIILINAILGFVNVIAILS